MENNMFVEAVLPGAILRKLSDEEMDRYRQPLPTPESRKPTWRWPNEIPIEGQPPDVHAAVQAYAEWMGKSPLPKLLLYAQPGAILRNLVPWCEQNIANLKTQEVGAGVHFLQEDDPHGIGEAIAAWMREELGARN
jgi:haloalkane dehalogenase